MEPTLMPSLALLTVPAAGVATFLLGWVMAEFYHNRRGREVEPVILASMARARANLKRL